MCMDILVKKQSLLESTLTLKELRDIHSKSIRNFLNYLPYFKNEFLRFEIYTQLEDYFHDIELMSYAFTIGSLNKNIRITLVLV